MLLSKRVLLLSVMVVLCFSGMAKEFIKLNDGTMLACTIQEVCKTGVIYRPEDTSRGSQYVAWAAILYIKYKDGSKVRYTDTPPATASTTTVVKLQQKTKKIQHSAKSLLRKGGAYFDEKIGNNSRINKDTFTASNKNYTHKHNLGSEEMQDDTLQIIPIPLPLSIESNKTEHGVVPLLECKDFDFNMGYHDAEAYYKGKRAKNAVFFTTFGFIPAGIITYAAMKHSKPHPDIKHITDVSLLNNADYIKGYQLKAFATKKVRIKHGFWFGMCSGLITGVSLGILSANNSSNGGSGWGHHHHH